MTPLTLSDDPPDVIQCTAGSSAVLSQSLVVSVVCPTIVTHTLWVTICDLKNSANGAYRSDTFF